MTEEIKQALKGFSKLNREERLKKLNALGFLSDEDLEFLRLGSPVSVDLAEHFIENVIGFFQMPLGVATNFRINDRDYVIPMAVEETSIIAAASKTAKWVRDHGELTTSQIGKSIIGQIQVARVSDFETFKSTVLKNKAYLLECANKLGEGLCRRGGGFSNLTVRCLERPDSGHMAVVHLYCDPVDAMGANIMNQVCEGLKPHIERLTSEKVTMCILSNLVDSRITKAQVRLKDIDPSIGEGIQEASYFAEVDPYRATTNNKGVLNGIDPILLATGNDWRAVEAGVHAYATRDGQYRSITRWRMEGKDLVGTLEAPLIVGTVGGVTRLHPTAKMSLRILGVQSSSDLSQILAAVGLVQNLGALNALTTVGVVQGHMNLHAANLALLAGANKAEIRLVQEELKKLLSQQKKISVREAEEVLQQMRQNILEDRGAHDQLTQ